MTPLASFWRKLRAGFSRFLGVCWERPAALVTRPRFPHASTVQLFLETLEQKLAPDGICAGAELPAGNPSPPAEEPLYSSSPTDDYFDAGGLDSSTSKIEILYPSSLPASGTAAQPADEFLPTTAPPASTPEDVPVVTGPAVEFVLTRTLFDLEVQSGLSPDVGQPAEFGTQRVENPPIAGDSGGGGASPQETPGETGGGAGNPAEGAPDPTAEPGANTAPAAPAQPPQATAPNAPPISPAAAVLAAPAPSFGPLTVSFAPPPATTSATAAPPAVPPAPGQATTISGPLQPLAASTPTPPSTGAGALSPVDPSVSATEGSVFSGQVGSFTDSDGNTLSSAYTVAISWGDGQTSAGTVTGVGGLSGFQISGQHTFQEEGSYSISTLVSDSDGASTTVPANATVADAMLSSAGGATFHAAPALYSGPVGSFHDGNSAAAAASDYAAQITWGDGSAASAGTIQFAGNASFNVLGNHTYASGGSYTVQVTATDVGGQSTTFNNTMFVATSPLSWVSGSPTFAWTQTATANPTIVNPGAQTTAEGAAVSLQVSATDPGGYSLTFDVVNLPSGLSINTNSGVTSGTVGYTAAEDFGGSYSATVIAADGHGGSASQNFTWTITDTVRAPVLTSPGSQSNAQGDTVSLQVNATQPDSDQISYDATNLPAGLTIDNLSGLISGTIDNSSGAAGSPYSVTVTVSDNTADPAVTASQTFSWTVTKANHAPQLTSPGNQVNAAGDVVSLPLTATDADGNTLAWTATGLPAGLSIDPASGTISGTLAASAASATAYNVTVLVSDGMASASQSFTWAVNYVGVSSPGDQSNLDSDVVSLPLTASGPNGATLSFSATGLPPGLSIASGTGTISGTLTSTAHAATPYAVTVSVSDGTHTASQTFNWSVARLALATPADQDNREGSAVSLALSASDAVATPTFSATGLPVGVTINTSTGVISGTLGVSAHGSSPYQVTVTATDGTQSASQSFVWTVTPRVALVNPGSIGNAVGDAVSLPMQATALAGGTLAFSVSGLPAGLAMNTSTGVISGTIAAGAASATPYAVTVTASDGTSSSSQAFPWTVSQVFIPAPADQTNLDGDAVSLSAAAHYHGTGTLVYSTTSLPPGPSINTSTGLIIGTVSSTADTNSPYAVTVTATDGTNSGSQTFNWTINPRVSLTAPTDQSNAAGDVVSLQVLASDALNGTIAYSVSGLPSGPSINTTTGVISGTIAVGADTSSPYAVTVAAADATVSTSATFHWTVAHVFLANPGPQNSADGASIALALQGHDADSGTVTYAATTLPTGLTINTTTGFISGAIGTSAHGSSPFQVTVSASDGTFTTSQSFLWTVTQVGVTNPGDQTNTEGAVVSLTAVATTGGSGSPSYSAGSLPAGLTINATTGVISGTIAAGEAANGPFTTTVAATNGSTSSSQTFTWNVNPRVALTAPADQANVEGAIVSLQVQASESGATLSYSAANLPTGLSINTSTGVISGTIATGASAGGPYPVTVTASDGTYSTSQSFNWTVTHTPNTAPTLTNPGTQTNVAGDSVSLALTATDANNDPLTWSAAGLPDGLQIDNATGIISGSLTSAAIRNAPIAVTVTVDDGNGGITSQTFNWIVNDAAIVVQALSQTATEGSWLLGATVANFSDANTSRQPTDYTAAINWGDGTNDTGTVNGSAGSFSVTADHLYAHPGSYTLTVTISDPVGGTASASASASVAAAPLSATGGLARAAVQGVAVTQTIASFTDANPTELPTSYSVSINWGDGSGTTSGTVSGNNGVFVVSGSHPYASDGNYTATATITDPDGSTASASSTVAVGDLYAGETANLTVAAFATTDSTATAASFSATIAWGDGTSTSGTVSGSTGHFQVSGSHTFAADNSYAVQVTITDQTGHFLSAFSTVIVVRPQLALHSSLVDATQGGTLTNVEVGDFIDPNTGNVVGEYSATINWGDGSSSSGTVTGSTGLFHVLGSHSYTTVGVYAVAVNVLWADPWPEDWMVGEVNSRPKIGLFTLPRLYGTTVVAGGSRVTYILAFNDATYDPKAWEHWLVTGMVGAKSVGGISSERGKFLGLDVVFPNKPGQAVIQITIKNFRPLKLPVTIVQVKIGQGTIFSKPNQFRTRANGGQVVVTTRPPDPRHANQELNYDPEKLKYKATADAEMNKGVVGFQYQVLLKGVGTGSLTGVDQLTVGWVQDINAPTIKVTYGTGSAAMKPQDSRGRPLRGPFLDSARDQLRPPEIPGTGGQSAFTKSWSVQVDGVSRPKGKVRVVQSLDSPHIPFLKTNRENGSDWVSIKGGQSFTTYLVAYSEKGPFNYTVYGKIPWSLTYDGTKDGRGLWKRDMKHSKLVIGTTIIQTGFPKSEYYLPGFVYLPPTIKQAAPDFIYSRT